MTDDSELRRAFVLSGVSKMLRSVADGRGFVARSLSLSSSRGRVGMGPDFGGAGGALRGTLPVVCQRMFGA